MSAWRHVPLLVVLVLAVPTAHFGAWDLGLYLDDHGHRAMLQRGGWSYAELVRASELDYAGDIMRMWWQRDEPAKIAFYRPLSFLLYKLEFTLVGGSPAAMHIVGLALHAACAMLVFGLGHVLWRRRDLALLAGLVFVAHPQLVQAVQWNAARTELWAGLFVLSAFLLHVRAIMLPRHYATPGDMTAPAVWTPARMGMLVCYVAALFCRENAVMFPFAAALTDLALTGRRAVGQRRTLYATLLALAIGYVVLRTLTLGGFPTPPPPYYRCITSDGFATWAVGKTLYQFAAVFTFMPVVPVATMEYLSHRPWLWAGVSLVPIALLLLAAWRLRSRRELLACLAFVAVFLLPTVPLFEGAWYLYLPAAGASVALAGLVGSLGQARQMDLPTRWDQRRRQLAQLAAMGLLAACGFGTFANTFALRSAIFREQMVQADVLRRVNEPPVSADTELFYINLPLVAHYVTPAVREALHQPGMNGWVLTFAPHVFGQLSPAEVAVLDAHTLEVWLPDEQRYFADALGRALYRAADREPLRSGEVVDNVANPFVVTVVDADSAGVRRLRFRFRKALADPRQRIFFGTQERPAFRLEFPPVATPRDAP